MWSTIPLVQNPDLPVKFWGIRPSDYGSSEDFVDLKKKIIEKVRNIKDDKMNE